MKIIESLCLFIVLSVMSATGWAFSTENNEPIHITSDKATVNDADRIVIYEGSVKVVQGTTEVLAERVEVTYDEEQQLQLITAKGKPAHYRQQETGKQEMRARAEHMQYYAQQDMLHLNINAYIEQSKNTFKGEHIVYDIKQNRITAESEGSRVESVIQPTKKNNDNPDDAKEPESQE